MTNLESILKSRDITLPTKVCIVKDMFFSSNHAWMWELNHKKGWRPGTDAFEMWCWMTLERPLNCKEMKSANPKGNQPWIFTGCTNAEAEAPIIWPPDAKSLLLRKDPDAGKDWGQEVKGVTEIEMVGWHHWLNGHEFEQTQGDSEGRGSVLCCHLWDHKESDKT